MNIIHPNIKEAISKMTPDQMKKAIDMIVLEYEELDSNKHLYGAISSIVVASGYGVTGETLEKLTDCYPEEL